MTFNPPATLPGTGSSSLRAGFNTHKYLPVAIVECLQEHQPRRAAPPDGQPSGPAVHRWMREPSAGRETTPCIVMREHLDRGDLSVVPLALHRWNLQTHPLAVWMRRAAAATQQPDNDRLHLAMAPTLPGVPILVHSIAADGEAFTHTFSGGVWSVCRDDQFLLRAIRHAQLLATAIPLGNTNGLPRAQPGMEPSGRAQPLETAGDDRACDLATLGRVYDHIAVHAALNELRQFRHEQGRQRVASPVEAPVSGR